MEEKAVARLVRASQSEELRQTFRQIADIEGPEGTKYPRLVLLDLAARVVGRAYEPMLLELCHLVRAAMLAGRASPEGRVGMAPSGFEWLFWGVEHARARHYRVAFAHCGTNPDPEELQEIHANVPLTVDGSAVSLWYRDGRFEVRYGRMANLAAMMELLVSTLGYRTLVDILEPLAAAAPDRSVVSATSRELARRFYGWLGDHLPAAQMQRKFQAIAAFLEDALGASFTVEDIDDEVVLRFWLCHCGCDGGSRPAGAKLDLRGYRTTFLAFLAFCRVLEAGSTLGGLERMTPIGADIDGGEVDPSEGLLTAHVGGEEDPLVRLEMEPAAAIKALNRRELSLVSLPVRELVRVRQLPRSYLRAECFGPLQNRLSQALRRRADSGEIAALAMAGPEPGYGARVESLARVRDHVLCVAKACLYVVHRAATGGNAEGHGGGGDRLQRLDFRLLGEARKAFEKLNRAGFERAALDDPRLAPAYAVLAEALPTLAGNLEEVLRALGEPAAWEAAEADDRAVFARAFLQMYGTGAHGGRQKSDPGTQHKRKESLHGQDVA